MACSRGGSDGALAGGAGGAGSGDGSGGGDWLRSACTSLLATRIGRLTRHDVLA